MKLERNASGKAQIPLADADRIRDIPKVGIVDVTLWVSEVRLVEQVKCLDSKLKIDAFGDRDPLERTGIDIKVTRSDQVVSTCIAEPRTVLGRPVTVGCAVPSSCDSVHRVAEVRIANSDASQNADITQLVRILSAATGLKIR